MKEKGSKTKYLWYAIALGLITVFLLMLLSSVISVGERLRNVHLYLEYIFYVLVVLLVYLLILRPVSIILFSPSFSVQTTLDKNSRRNYSVYKKVAKRLMKNEKVPEELRIELKDNLRN